MAGRQRFYSLFNEANHLIAHIHHNITDFVLDLNDPIETRILHLGELPISQAGLATVTQAATQRPGSNQESTVRVPTRISRTIGRRVSQFILNYAVFHFSFVNLACRCCNSSYNGTNSNIFGW